MAILDSDANVHGQAYVFGDEIGRPLTVATIRDRSAPELEAPEEPTARQPTPRRSH
jgi:hypothetical protein